MASTTPVAILSSLLLQIKLLKNNKKFTSKFSRINSLCKNIFLIFLAKFPVFSLSGKMDLQIPCFPCAVATLLTRNYFSPTRIVPSSVLIAGFWNEESNVFLPVACTTP